MEKNIMKIIDNLQEAERRFYASTFLAPCIKQGSVRTRIAGVIHTFRITNPDFEGWAVFRPISRDQAEIIREATPDEVRQYLDVLPQLRVVLAEEREGYWTACPVNISDAKQRFGMGELFLPCLFVRDALKFEQVVTRFDGANLWFEDIDNKRDPRVADALRQALAELKKPDTIRIATLTPEERLAYIQALGLEIKARKGEVEVRIEGALEHAGAQLVRFTEHGQEVVVTWRERSEYTSVVRKSDLMVISAGICVSGEDRKFDLTSLVSVVRVAEHQHRVHRTRRVIDGGPVEQDWRDLDENYDDD